MKKILSIFLAALIVSAIVPFGTFTAYADESLLRQRLQDPTDGDIELSENIKLSHSIIISEGSHSLDLAGKVLSIGDAATETDGKMPAITINGGSLLIRDSVGGGSISVYGNQTPAIQVDGGRVSLKSGTIKATGRDASLGILIRGESSFTMDGGTVSVSGALTIGVTVSAEADFTMNGGTILASGSISSIGLFADKAVKENRIILNRGYISGTTYSISISGENAAIADVGALIPASVSVIMDGTSYGRASFKAKAYSLDMSIGGAAAPQSAAVPPDTTKETPSDESGSDPESNPNTGTRIHLAALWLIPVIIVTVCFYLISSFCKSKKQTKNNADSFPETL